MKIPSFLMPAIRLLRRPIGLICLFIGVLGFILPILPGWPFIIPAVVLLGRRDRALRFLHYGLRIGLRMLRRSRISWVQQLGNRLATEYVRGRKAIMPTIIKAEQSMPWHS